MNRHRISFPLVVVLIVFVADNSVVAADNGHDRTAHLLWYAAPAAQWENQALPIGNGRLGGMIFGGVSKERIQFNEDSLWIGDESDTGSYQAFGDVVIDMPHEEFRNYRRQLDIDRAIHTVTYDHGQVRYTRTYLSSHPAQAMVLRFAADKPGAHSGKITLTDAHRAKIIANASKITSAGSLAGYVAKDYKGSEPYRIVLDYEAQLLVQHEGGTLEAAENSIVFENCDSLTFLLVADTNYLNQRAKGWKGEHPHTRITAQLEAAAKKSFDTLLSDHVRDYRTLFDRCALDLGTTDDAVRQMPTDKRLAAYKSGAKDPQLEELLFQYARYLMISSSRPGSMPANLQGLWNQTNKPPWRSDYHTDVNVQMNYWFVDAANLSECFEPLSEWLQSIRSVRRDETKKTFGTRGWITHAENGVFGGSTWKWSKGDAAWVAQNLWDHYAFTRDEGYLRRRAYPIMKELCEFWIDHLNELPDGTLVSPNGFSPEQGPHEDGVSFDQQLVWDLFSNFIEASEVLSVDEPMRDKIASMRAALLGPKIGRWGQLQEWTVDRDDPTNKHRHISHMIAVYPGRQIAPATTPKLAEAARVSMRARGIGTTGWSRAHRLCVWARLLDGDQSYKVLHAMVQTRFLDNLYGTHPPFQIDANFGYAAGVCEMLVQSHAGQLHLLPAISDAWNSGSFRGLRARGGLEVDVAWQNGRATEAVLKATIDGRHVLRPPAGQQIDGPSTVNLKAGQTYKVQFK